MKRSGNRALALLVAGAFFMEILDGAVLATAAPSIATSLHVRPADVAVVITAYLVAVAAGIPVSGWLVDRFGGRLIFTVAVVVFTLSSALCAVAWSLPVLTALRVVQGVGGALMVPVGRLVVMRATRREDVIAAIAYLTWPALLAPVIAPVLGGTLSQYASWRWIFLINVPIGMVTLIFAVRLVPSDRQSARAPFDRSGFLLTAAALASITYGSALLADARVRWTPAVICYVSGAVAVTLAVRRLRTARHPLISLDALRIRTFRVSHTGGSVFRLLVSAIPFLLPLLFQEAFGWSPSKAGLMVVAVFVGNIAIKPATTPLLRRFGFRLVLMIATSGAGLSIAACALLTADTPWILTAALLAIGGAFRSIGFTAYNTLAYADLGSEEMNHANTLASTLQQLALGLGVAAGAGALRVGEALHPSATLAAYGVAFVLLGVLFIPALVEAIRLPRAAGRAIGGGSDGSHPRGLQPVRQNGRHDRDTPD